MNAMSYIAGKRVNCELLLFVNDKNILHIGVRLRPWKQESRNPEMILVQGLDLTDAMNNAARSLYREEWRRLDFQARPWNNPTFDTETGESPDDLDFLATQPLSVTPQALRVINGSQKPKKEPPGLS